MNKTDEKIFSVDRQWAAKYPKAKAGILLVTDIQNSSSHAELDKFKSELETSLRTFSRFFPGELQ